MKFEIRRVKNGSILTAFMVGDESKEELVCQEKFDEDDEVDCFAEFLQLINEHYGPSTNRYSEKRIHISVGPGDKYEKPINQ